MPASFATRLLKLQKLQPLVPSADVYHFGWHSGKPTPLLIGRRPLSQDNLICLGYTALKVKSKSHNCMAPGPWAVSAPTRGLSAEHHPAREALFQPSCIRLNVLTFEGYQSQRCFRPSGGTTPDGPQRLVEILAGTFHPLFSSVFRKPGSPIQRPSLTMTA